MRTETTVRKLFATCSILAIMVISARVALSQTQADQKAATNSESISLIKDHLTALANDQMTTLQRDELQRKFFAEYGRKVFEGTVECADVLDSGDNIMIKHRLNNGALLQVLIPKTDIASVQKAKQIKRGDKAVVRGVLAEQPWFRGSIYLGVSGDWVAELVMSSVSSIVSPTK